jgi:hypothetical protein
LHTWFEGSSSEGEGWRVLIGVGAPMAAVASMACGKPAIPGEVVLVARCGGLMVELGR